VVVLGDAAEAVQAEVARRRAAGERAAGFVGDDRAAAEAMAAELFGAAAAICVLFSACETENGTHNGGPGQTKEES
jgi:hypothetical protein